MTIDELLKAASRGNADAQVMLANHYHTGNGVAKDDAEARRWLRAAADQGHVMAMFLQGLALTRGMMGFPIDGNMAVPWLRKAAAANHADSQLLLGGLYLGDKGVAADSQEAVKWLRKAAAQGHPVARGVLASLGTS